MKEKKFKDDYTVRTTLSDRGRTKQEIVYQGEYFRFSGGAKEKRSVLLQSLTCAGVFFLPYLGYMKLNTPSSRCIYVMPLAAVALIPFVYWCMGLYTLGRCKDQLTRLQKETGIGRVLRASIGCAVLLAMACTGDLAYMLLVLKERITAEIPGFALLLCAAIAAMGSFLRAKEAYTGITVIAGKGDGVKQ